MIDLYMDVHVHDAITRGLRQRGVNVLRAQDDGAAELEDPDLLDRAAQSGRLLLTQDKDFLVEAAKRQQSGVVFAGIIYAPQDSAMINRYIEDLELIATLGESREFADRLKYLPL